MVKLGLGTDEEDPTLDDTSAAVAEEMPTLEGIGNTQLKEEAAQASREEHLLNASFIPSENTVSRICVTFKVSVWHEN